MVDVGGQEQVIGVEDWAEIRRLHRAERMGIKAIARHMGVARNTVREALRSDVAAALRAGAGRGSIVDAGGAGDPGVVEGVPDDAGDGDRRADRLDAFGAGCCATGWPSCGRCSCRPIRASGPVIARASSPSSICGSPTTPDPAGSRPGRDKLWVMVGLDGLFSVPGRLDDPVPGGP